MYESPPFPFRALDAVMRRARAKAAAIAVVAAIGFAGARGAAADPLPVPPSAESADSINALLKLNRFAEAETRSRTWLARLDAEQGPDSTQALVLDLLVRTLASAGKWTDPESRSLGERAIRLKESVYGPDHAEVAKSLIYLAHLLDRAGAYFDARPLAERALAIYERTPGETGKSTRWAYHVLGSVLDGAGDYPASKAAFRKELELDEALSGPESADAASALNSLAILARRTADYAEGRRLYERSLAIREKTLGPEHEEVSWSLNNYANLLADMGDFEGARKLYERANWIRERVLGPEHPGVALGLANLAEDLLKLGEADSARLAFQRALTIQQKALGPDHYQSASILDGLGAIAADAGDSASARRMFERALSIREKAFGPDHPRSTEVMMRLARLLDDEGDSSRARQLLVRVVRTQERAYGAENMHVAEAVVALAEHLHRTGDERGALDAAVRAEAIGTARVRITVRSLEERMALKYAATRPSGLDLALTVACASGSGPEIARRAFDAVIRSRALVLDEMAARHRAIATSGDSSVQGLAEEYRAESETLARLAVRGELENVPKGYQKALEAASRRKERAEAALAHRSASFRSEQARSAAGYPEVKAALPEGTTLISFVRFDRYMGGHRDPFYAAFLTRPGSDAPSVLLLGSAFVVDSLVERWSAAAGHEPDGVRRAQSEASCREVGAVLRRLVWDPLTRRFGERGASSWCRTARSIS